MNSSHKNQKLGMGIVGVLVAAAIFGILMMSMSTFMTDTIKIGKTVDAKSQAQSLESLIRLSLAKPEACNSIMGLDKTPNPLTFPAGNLPAPGSPAFSLAVPSLTIGGVTYAKDSLNGDLQLVDIYMLIDQPITTGSDQYIASFQIATKLAQGKTLGHSQFLVSLPLKITLERDGTNAKVVACNADSLDADPEQTCESMGGRWFDGDQGDMARERCAFGSETTLDYNERPDHINRNGLANDRGEAPVDCYYSKGGTSSRVQVWKCPQSSGAGYRCWFDSTSKRWNVGYFTKGTTSNVPSTNPTYYECNKGVKIAISPENSETYASGILSLRKVADEDGDDSLPLASDPLHDLYLPAIIGCKKNSSDQTPFACENQDDPSKDTLSNGKMGKGSNGCYFVRNARVYTSGTYLKSRYNTLTKNYNVIQAGLDGDSSEAPRIYSLASKEHDTSSLYGYTGWVISSGHGRTITASGGAVTVNQGLGYPCEEVQVNKQTIEEIKALGATYSDNSVAPSAGFATTAEAEAKEIQECVWGATGGSNATGGNNQPYIAPSKVYRVGNTSTIANTTASAGTEVIGREFCSNNSQLGSYTLEEAINGKNAAGDPVNVNVNGICVYVKNHFVTNYFPKSKEKGYTGWVKLKTDYVNPNTGAAKYSFDSSGAFQIIAPNTELNAFPCSMGVIKYNPN